MSLVGCGNRRESGPQSTTTPERGKGEVVDGKKNDVEENDNDDNDASRTQQALSAVQRGQKKPSSFCSPGI